ncbi:putative pectinesterase/pectinesterase inhibitor 45 [Forsythia ovata]|uniref:Pectinesterase n=1 Tax=Forsythia ovata TaxID=205694 RepID=A0ABD1XCJ5_9LAMI
MAFQDIDQILLRKKEERKQRLKKRITIGIVLIFFLLLVAAVICLIVYKDRENTKPESHPKQAGLAAEKAVKMVCEGTDYQETCKHSLLKAVKNNASIQPKDILKASISIVSNEIDKVIKQISNLKFDTTQRKAAFNDCMVLLNDAKEELNSSIWTISGKNLAKLSSRTPDLNNWLSAVISYQQTCIDGFPEGQEKAAVQKLLKNAKELGSNALAIVAQVSSVFTKFQVPNVKRNLQDTESSLSPLNEDGFPTWIDEEDRRMLGGKSPKQSPNVTVAKDGSGNYTTISAALKAMPKKYVGRYVIYLKQGVYEENVVVTKNMVNVTMYGDGSQKSVVTGSKNFVDRVPTFQTATFAALGEGFMAQSIGFRNTAGPEKHQAVALRVQADHSIFVNCRMEGYQDTLYAQTHRQFYRSCYITGTIDFIFGDASAIFQNCMINVRKPMDNQQNIVTAQGRVDRRETTGIVLQNCKILADEKLQPNKAKVKSYLGRPWKEYSRTIVMESDIDDLISPEGWLEWNGEFALKTLHYAEYNNKGPGSNTSGRVKWPGYRIIKREEAMKYTIVPFLQGESWLKTKNVPVRFGLFS